MALLQRVVLKNVRCIESLEVPLDHAESTLPGSWTCIAGINGSGKTTVLQAIAVALLVDRYSELGDALVHRMRRREGSSVLSADIDLQIGRGPSVRIQMRLTDDSKPVRSAIVPVPLVVGFGATRTIAEFNDGRWSHVSTGTRRLVNLFDPLSQVTSASALLAAVEPGAGWVLFATLLEKLPLPLMLATEDGQRWLDTRPIVRKVRFTTPDGLMGATDLPDGYRSTLAWLADLCLQHGADHPEIERLDEVVAVVLIDEIDLHLHPKLQRELVPSLRAALPNVQWIVTTHSPLVLTCFDRREIVALDRDVPGGIRELDRQVVGFTADDVYKWLMDTPPSGAAMPQLLQDRPDEAEVALTSSPELSEEEARQHVEERKRRLSKVLGEP